jgi:hypothetical protein
MAREEFRDLVRNSVPDRDQNRGLSGADLEYQLARELRKAHEELDRLENDPADVDHALRLGWVGGEDLGRQIENQVERDEQIAEDPEERVGDRVGAEVVDSSVEPIDRDRQRERDEDREEEREREEDRDEEREEDREKEEEEREKEEREQDSLPGNVIPIALGVSVAAEAAMDEEREGEGDAAPETEAAAREMSQRGDAEPGVDPPAADVDPAERTQAVEADVEADPQTPQTRDQEAVAAAPEFDDRPVDEHDERAEVARPADAGIDDRESAGRQREEIARPDEGLDDRATDSQTGADEGLDRDGLQPSRENGVDTEDELDARAGGDESTVHEPEPVLATAGDRAEANKVETSQNALDRAVTTAPQVSNDQSEALPDDALKARGLNEGGQRPASGAATAPPEAPTATTHAGVTPGQQYRNLRESTEQEYTGHERSIER